MTTTRPRAIALSITPTLIGALLLATACTTAKPTYAPDRITCQMAQLVRPDSVSAPRDILDAFARSNAELEVLVVHHEMMSGNSFYRRLIQNKGNRYLVRTAKNGISDTIQFAQDIKLNQLGIEKLAGHFFSMELSKTDAPYYDVQVKQAGYVTSSYSYTGSLYCLSEEDQAKVKQLYELGQYILSL